MPNEVKINFGAQWVGLLGILFVALKLTGHIDWSWWWVLAPFWIGAGVTCIILALVLILIIMKGFFL